MIVNKDLEKEVELAEDLKGKLDEIEGKKPRRKTKTTVKQEVASPRDAEVDAEIGEFDKMNKKLSEIAQEMPVTSSYFPDPIKHKYISFIKSAFRIGAGAALVLAHFEIAGALFIIAELLGIAEELV